MGVDGAQLLGRCLTAVILRVTLLSYCSHLLLFVCVLLWSLYSWLHFSVSVVLLLLCPLVSSWIKISFRWSRAAGATKGRGRLHREVSHKNFSIWVMADDLGLRFSQSLKLGLGLGQRQRLELQLELGCRGCWRMLSLLSIFWQVIHKLLLIFDSKKMDASVFRESGTRPSN